MLANDITTSWRVIRKDWASSILNVAGLGVGMAVCILMLLWVSDELSYDRFHGNASNLYLVYSDKAYSDGRTTASAASYYPLARTLKDDCPEVRDAVRVMEVEGIVVSRGDASYSNDRIVLADPSFFTVFSFHLVRGEPKTVFADPHSAVLSQTAVRKYFGGEDPIGKRMTVDGQIDLTVTGVVQDVPGNSSIQFDIAAPFPFAWGGPHRKEPQHWGGNPLNTYVLLRSGSSVPDVGRKATASVNRRMGVPAGMTLKMALQPITRMHLHSIEGGGPILIVTVFAAVAILVLAVACFNFVNLMTARATTRTNEVGLRKVVGARRADLVRRFLVESTLVALLSFLLALVLVAMGLPAFSTLTGKRLAIDMISDPRTMAALFGIAIATGVAAGAYPAFFLSSLRLQGLLKAASPLHPRGTLSRRILVIAQCVISVFLILGAMTIHRQIRMMSVMDLGYDRSNLYLVDLPEGLRPQYDVFRQELLRIPGVVGVTRCAQSIDNINSTVSAVDWDGKNPGETISMNWDYVDYDYFETLGMTMLEGRGFSRAFTSDPGKAYVINEAAARLMGLDSPVGRRLSVFRKEGVIIGVVKNFNFRPLRHKIDPIVLGMDPEWLPNMAAVFIRLAPGRLADSVPLVDSTFRKLFPGTPLASHFPDEMTGRHYGAERRMERIVGFAALVAIFVSSLGLFGLASFMAERRTKEIGIRKVLGGTTIDLVVLLMKQIVTWVFLANVLAWPLAYAALVAWLRNYAHRVAIEPWTFAAAACVSLSLATLTVGLKTIRVAAGDPVEALRYE